MSRIGKKPIQIPAGTTVAVANNEIIVRGKGGELKRTLHPAVSVTVTGNEVVVSPALKNRLARALWGTYASHVRNMVEGVNQPFSKRLEVQGIGYRAEVSGKSLKLQVGFSHPVVMTVPDGITVTVDKNIIIISGADKEGVGQFAASIREAKKPEPYKGKGIRYEGEAVRQKAGKRAVTTAV